MMEPLYDVPEFVTVDLQNMELKENIAYVQHTCSMQLQENVTRGQHTVELRENAAYGKLK